jgi:predicted kinase
MQILADIMTGAKPTFEALVSALSEDIGLLAELANTPQDARWHAEGDVAVHTSMVLAELYDILETEAAALSPERRLALVLGALLHDIAKPLVTRHREIDGEEQIIAPRHADKGRSYLAYRLPQLDLPYAIMRDILALVGHHHDIVYLVRDGADLARFRRLARMADLELLYYLEKADMRGRYCQDLQEQLDIIELFRMFAVEYGLWQNPQPYAHWHAEIDEKLAEMGPKFCDMVFARAVWDAEKSQICSPEEAIARSYRYRDGYAQVVVLCGPSGSGKSSWLHNNLGQYEIISLDDLRSEISGDIADQSDNRRIRHLATEQFKAHLRLKRNIVWDATNLRRDFRQQIIRLACDYGALAYLVVFLSSKPEVFERNLQRQRIVPPNILEHQLDYTEWPYADEAHIFTVVRGTSGQILETAPLPLLTQLP